MIHINWFMGAPTLFFFFFYLKGGTLIGPSPLFFETLGTHPTIEVPPWTPSTKIEINILSYGPPFSVSTDESWTLGKP
jgi:hypothetical protein